MITIRPLAIRAEPDVGAEQTVAAIKSLATRVPGMVKGGSRTMLRIG